MLKWIKRLHYQRKLKAAKQWRESLLDNGMGALTRSVNDEIAELERKIEALQ